MSEQASQPNGLNEQHPVEQQRVTEGFDELSANTRLTEAEETCSNSHGPVDTSQKITQSVQPQQKGEVIQPPSSSPPTNKPGEPKVPNKNQHKSKVSSRTQSSSNMPYNFRKSASPKTVIRHQPLRRSKMTMFPHPGLSPASTAIATNSEAYQLSEAAKAPLRARQRQIEEHTSWQRTKWRCQLKPCWEAPGGCFYGTSIRGNVHGDGTDGTGHGHGDGCCEMMGLRSYFCTVGCQHFGEDGCCEGCGCVRCCAWEHGIWDALDACFGENGCLVKCFGGLKS